MSPRKGAQRPAGGPNGRETGQDTGKPVRRRGGPLARLRPLTWAEARCEATPDGWHFALPTPERTNAMWRQWQGKTLVSKRHRLDKQLAPARFGAFEPMRGEVAVRLVWVRHRRVGDVDSRVKAALDLLTAIGVWVDDGQVVDLHVIRSDEPTRAPGLYVWVWPADAPRVEAA